MDVKKNINTKSKNEDRKTIDKNNHLNKHNDRNKASTILNQMNTFKENSMKWVNKIKEKTNKLIDKANQLFNNR